MKTIHVHKLSTIILWSCITISILIFSIFYYELTTHPDWVETAGISLILNWLYFILFISIATTLAFSLFQFALRWRDKPTSIIQPFIWIVALAALFWISYLFGNGTPLHISGYAGKENSYFWLKLTDMWIYTLYILLAMNLTAVFAGIIWSYIKKV